MLGGAAIEEARCADLFHRATATRPKIAGHDSSSSYLIFASKATIASKKMIIKLSFMF